MKKEFKVGDRIKTYGYDSSGAQCFGAIHVVTEVMGPWIRARFIGDEQKESKKSYTFHVHQCRRIVKKPAREWWMVFSHPTDTLPGAFDNEERALEGLLKLKGSYPNAFVVKVREVRGKGK